MDSFSEDEGPPPMETKHAARISENDRDKLLASGDEREEYTGLYEFLDVRSGVFLYF